MYTDEDLNLAVKEGIFTEQSVRSFRDFQASSNKSPSVDEENIRLIGGFNDIFIVISCLLLLFSSWWVIKSSTQMESLGLVAFSLLAWGLAEYFVRQRRLALPAIVLLVAFVSGIFFATLAAVGDEWETASIIAAAMACAAAYCHWLRFKVPITIAAGTAALVALAISTILYIFPLAQEWFLAVLIPFGVFTFCLAMYWDAADTQRITGKSDVAFWLHLLAAPMIIHPLFASLGVLGGSEDIVVMGLVIVLYILMTLVSIIIDRRAFMVSSLIYVLYALSSVLETYGGIGYSLALTGLFMGATLLILSAYWHSVRVILVSRLPLKLTNYLPDIQGVEKVETIS